MSEDRVRGLILEKAAARKGLPYRLEPPPDGEKTIDCSLFVLKTYEDAGLVFPPGVRTAEDIRQRMIPLAFSEVQAGDALFFKDTYDAGGTPGPDGIIASHIGISLGLGTKRMWDANDGRGNVGITDISTPYWQEHIFEARRHPSLTTPTAKVFLQGVDVSEYQDVNWDVLAKTPIGFVVVRASQRTDRVDKKFATHWPGAKRAGKVRVAYHFAEPATDPDPASEVAFFRSVVGKLEPGDGIALDLEEWEGVLAGYSGNVAAWTLQWLRTAKVLFGVTPLLYTNAGIVYQYGLDKVPGLAEFPLYLADWSPPYEVPPPWTRWTLLQTGANGRVDGIGGDVDTDVFDGSAEELRNLGYKDGLVRVKYYEDDKVGSGLLELMAADGTEPACNSTFFPLGQNPADVEECYALNGSKYVWYLKTNQHFRYDPA